VEEEIFIPAVRNAERKLKQNDVSAKISSMINQTPNSDEQLSDREKDVIIALVQGMSNKEIADHLFISVNTVITHQPQQQHKKLQRTKTHLDYSCCLLILHW
jgi:regulator of cell morphogenesis and NO signaling